MHQELKDLVHLPLGSLNLFVIIFIITFGNNYSVIAGTCKSYSGASWTNHSGRERRCCSLGWVSFSLHIYCHPYWILVHIKSLKMLLLLLPLNILTCYGDARCEFWSSTVFLHSMPINNLSPRPVLVALLIFKRSNLRRTCPYEQAKQYGHLCQVLLGCYSKSMTLYISK